MTNEDLPRPKAKRIRCGDVLVRAEREKRTARAEEFGGLRGPTSTPEADAMLDAALTPDNLSERAKEVGVGGELVPLDSRELMSAFRDTLTNPNHLAKDASQDRLELLQEAGGPAAVELGLDAAGTARARNSIEKMLAHQIAAAHIVVMEMLGQMRSEMKALPTPDQRSMLSGEYDTVNKGIARSGNTVARLGIMVQQGTLALQRLQQGARQTMRIEHVQLTQVAPSGQAVVAGRVRGSRRGG
jgi:hypothetical protein